VRVGYCVNIAPTLASYRLRVAIPAIHLGCDYVLGATGKPSFFYKNGHVELARKVKGVVYDVVNDHFTGPHAADYHGMCKVADVITCSSPVMAEIVKKATGRDATVIPDPYENEEDAPAVRGDQLVWFGHQANFSSLEPYADLDPWVCAGAEWSLDHERQALKAAAVVMLTGNNPGASANRPVKAIRAGRFVVCPKDSPESWKDLAEFIWVGDVRDGIDWALNNREEACRKILAGQDYIRKTFSPRLIGSQWAALFASNLAQGTKSTKAGSALISP
jgi:hypothetical protein